MSVRSGVQLGSTHTGARAGGDWCGRGSSARGKSRGVDLSRGTGNGSAQIVLGIVRPSGAARGCHETAPLGRWPGKRHRRAFSRDPRDPLDPRGPSPRGGRSRWREGCWDARGRNYGRFWAMPLPRVEERGEEERLPCQPTGGAAKGVRRRVRAESSAGWRSTHTGRAGAAL